MNSPTFFFFCLLRMASFRPSPPCHVLRTRSLTHSPNVVCPRRFSLMVAQVNCWSRALSPHFFFFPRFFFVACSRTIVKTPPFGFQFLCKASATPWTVLPLIGLSFFFFVAAPFYLSRPLLAQWTLIFLIQAYDAVVTSLVFWRDLAPGP